ncbi:hypothetical protein GJ631_15055 [Natronomonas sp. CBA1123]|uniref:hypothetical protein n=1 Tax=Natronomonas sp. CBA1123 TaxID=2668070 RepID=UPI0012E9F589|nr:hypothetical protein [Natronomonas sp. CBA1123]MUV87834.1 hypothetical protein [Natronomonas sp. CBA1123]
MLEAIAEAAPSTGTLALVVLAFLAGATAPTYYAQERLRGFGRAVASRLPYKPPAGMETGEAMEAATQAAVEQQTIEEDENAER